MTAKLKDSPFALPYQERVRLTRERLRMAQRLKIKELPKLDDVLAAEKLVAEWERKNDEYERAQSAAHQAKMNEINDLLILGDTAQAIALIKQIEAER